MHSRHHIPTAFRREFATPGLWWTRALVMGAAALAGLTVVAFTWLAETAHGAFLRLAGGAWWLPLLWTPVLTAFIVWLTRRYAAGAGGSGIPQVMASLEPEVGDAQRGLFVSLKLSAAKIGLTAAGLLGGLSLGREGPSVQIAAGVMHAVRPLLPRRALVSTHALLVAGGAAGIAAAFNTPLAGVMFAIEELSGRPEQRNSGLIVAGIVLAGLIAVSAHGNATHFGVIHPGPIGWGLLGPGLLTALIVGVAGGLFARLLLASLGGRSPDRFSRWRARRPVLFAAGCGLAVAGIGLLTHGAAVGSGNEATKAMLDGGASPVAGFALHKLAATWLTVWSGAPAGIFAPSLAIGAALGHDIGVLTAYPHVPALIALGMAGFLAAATQAPLTAFIIVMEMVDGHAMVLSLMACAVVASTISRVLSPPLYGALAQLQLERVASR
ncbi:H+/Cl- antiporter ClcA [Pseudoduganella flava]|uniref:Chloride channel protein n=1 Tax=Pseudoduganella flava TaxID=871742 RepID=A0A562PZB8_9BURK|nr:chloride channel protein [Pseudoduganella flava]QGZ38635.1 chloride channel protein [Pseudoduganella flava]TWI49791.1 H+/Cl- antiporter ClcA [Pseudoduganella flava]